MNDGIAIILKRMDTNPEEFYGDGGKWKFMYQEYFRDVMTEEEKAALHTKIKEVRRNELTSKVMKALTAEVTSKDEWVEKEMLGFGAAPIKAEGQAYEYKWVAEPPSKQKKTIRINANQMNALNKLMKQGLSREAAMEALGYK